MSEENECAAYAKAPPRLAMFWWNLKQMFQPKEESNLVSHARMELELAGFSDKDSDYDGMLMLRNRNE